MQEILCPFCGGLIGEIDRVYNSVTIHLSINHVDCDVFECPKCEKKFEANLRFTLVDGVDISLGERDASNN